MTDKTTFDILLLIARPAAGKSKIIDYLDGLDLSPRPSQIGRELVAQGLSFSPVGETGEGLDLSALAGAIKKEWRDGSKKEEKEYECFIHPDRCATGKHAG